MNNIGEEVRKELFKLQDKKYQQFHSKLCPETINIIGVRIPAVRKLAKELFLKYEFSSLFNGIGIVYYEEIMLKGMLIGFLKDINEVIKYTSLFIPLIDNWAVCDSFCAGLKVVKKNKKLMREFILSYLESDSEFEVRFLLVMILNYYIDREYLESNFDIFEKIRIDDYYAQMALSWAICICIVKFYDETVSYLKRSTVSKFVYNKAISKACDSYRLDANKKKLLKLMRR